MAFIRSKKIKGREYFYLVESVREGKKIRQKVVKYLGRAGIPYKKTVNYLTARDINLIHEKIIRKFGGERGIMNAGFVDYASDYLLDRLYAAENPRDELIRRAARLMHMIIVQHPYIDGNKRTGFESARLFLILNGHDIGFQVGEAEKLCTKIGKGELTEKEVAEWLLKREREIRGKKRSAQLHHA